MLCNTLKETQMNKNDDFLIPEGYSGRILTGNYTVELKKRVADLLDIYHAFEKTGNPAMPYVSAWREEEMKIWYEFAGSRFVGLMDCKVGELADVLRESVKDRIIYRHPDTDASIEKKVYSSSELMAERKTLREEGRKEGIDAVYKISRNKTKSIWLKDVATVETFKKDRISLSLGCLTVVTKEMKAEEERLERERLQVILEMAGAVCHELNQPMQAISGYSENLALNVKKDDPLYSKLKKIMELAQAMGDITGKLMKITRYETKDYVRGIKIIDIDKSSGRNT
ncbi:MAG: HisKA protein [Thermodesulfobacteriota bacterium]|nr:HisKA protein [Thermodesulfobacteriota bacterium]